MNRKNLQNIKSSITIKDHDNNNNNNNNHTTNDNFAAISINNNQTTSSIQFRKIRVLNDSPSTNGSKLIKINHTKSTFNDNLRMDSPKSFPTSSSSMMMNAHHLIFLSFVIFYFLTSSILFIILFWKRMTSNDDERNEEGHSQSSISSSPILTPNSGDVWAISRWKRLPSLKRSPSSNNDSLPVVHVT